MTPSRGRHALELQCARGVDDHIIGQRRGGDLDGNRARREHDVVRLQDLRLAFVGGELDPAPGKQPPMAGQLFDAVALEQPLDASGEPVDHGVLLGDHAGERPWQARRR